MRSQETSVAVLPVSSAAQRHPDPAGAQVVVLAAVTAGNAPQVRIDADGSLVTARLAVPATRARLQLAVDQQQPVVVVFENGDRSRPVIIGFLERAETDDAAGPAAAAVGESAGKADDALIGDGLTSSAKEGAGGPTIEADVDGRRLRITAKDEIVLQCGHASVTLRRNGRVIIRGTYVETHSDGTNRIKGGQVQIN